MKTIYCISGLGADERAFAKLHIDGYRLQVIPWLLPEKNESIQHYATRMRAAIREENPILMGLSFGGMVCTEIAKQVPVQKLILISSVKSSRELPAWMKAVAWLRLHRIVPLKSTKLTEPIQNRMLGATSHEERLIASEYRKKVNIEYTNWAVNEAINWKNDWRHPDTVHIHGDSDRMFPIKYIRPTFTIKQGGHFMIMNKAADVSRCINEILQQNQGC